jgi:hypothetical protein
MLANPKTRNPFLRGAAIHSMVPAMKLLAAMGVLIGFASVLAAGMVLAVQGSPWLFVVSLGIFMLLFARIGCAVP